MIDRSNCKIVFMGSPDFAVPSLAILHENGYDICSVITATDKASGRGLKIRESAVKKYAVDNNINVIQPRNLKNKDFVNQLEELQADLFVVVAFRMLPEVVWSMPPKGTINLHASLLPDYRGAAPINWVLINGETETGATTFFIEKEIDTGKIILQEKVAIGENETAGELHDKLMLKGADLILETVDQIFLGSYTLMDQDVSLYRHKAPKIYKEDCRIDWNQPVDNVHNFIRGLSPFPGAWSTLEEKVCKIFYSEKTEIETDEIPGSIETDNKTFLHIACENGFLKILEIQMEGKKRLAVNEFLKGFHFDSQSILV